MHNDVIPIVEQNGNSVSDQMQADQVETGKDIGAGAN